MKLGPILVLAGILGATVLMAACAPSSSDPLPRRDPGATIESIWFVIEAYDIDDLPVSRVVGLTITPYGSDGKVIVRKDPVTREDLPPIAIESQRTPYAQEVILEQGVRGASLKVDFFGMHQGDVVKCHVEKGGQILPGTTNVSPMVRAGGSYVTVGCNYLGG